MARAHDVLRPGVMRDGGPDRGHAVGGRDTGGHAMARLDRDRERRAKAAAIVRRHWRQFKCAHLVIRQAQADDAAAFADHQGHGVAGDVFGGDDQVGLVLAIEIVEQDDRNAGAHGVQRRGDAAFQVVTEKGMGRNQHVKRSSQSGRKTHQGKAQPHARLPPRKAGQAGRVNAHIFFHPDYTVGSGIAPDLLTLPGMMPGRRSRARPLPVIPPVGNCTPPRRRNVVDACRMQARRL